MVDIGKTQPLRLLSLGWGVQSWTLAAMAALGDIPPLDYAVHADTTHEMAGTYAHAAKWTPWLEERGVKVATVREGRSNVVRKEWSVGKTGETAVMIPAFTLNTQTLEEGQTRRQCTGDWKIAPLRRFSSKELARRGLKKSLGAVTSIQGISLDEWSRMRTSDVRYITHEYPLVDMRMTRAGCVAYLEAHSLEVPPKSACSFCPFHSRTMWRKLKDAGGPDWDHAVQADEAIRERRPGLVAFIHPSRKPLAEAVQSLADTGQMEMDIEAACDGGYCFV